MIKRFMTITYVGPRSSIETGPRRKQYSFEQNKAVPIGHKFDEVNPKDAESLARKINNLGEFIFKLE